MLAVRKMESSILVALATHSVALVLLFFVPVYTSRKSSLCHVTCSITEKEEIEFELASVELNTCELLPECVVKRESDHSGDLFAGSVAKFRIPPAAMLHPTEDALPQKRSRTRGKLLGVFEQHVAIGKLSINDEQLRRIHAAFITRLRNKNAIAPSEPLLIVTINGTELADSNEMAFFQDWVRTIRPTIARRRQYMFLCGCQPIPSQSIREALTPLGFHSRLTVVFLQLTAEEISEIASHAQEWNVRWNFLGDEL